MFAGALWPAKYGTFSFHDSRLPRIPLAILWPLPTCLTFSLNPSHQIHVNMTVLVCILRHNTTMTFEISRDPIQHTVIDNNIEMERVIPREN